jgi:hypothetical protein
VKRLSLEFLNAAPYGLAQIFDRNDRLERRRGQIRVFRPETLYELLSRFRTP